LDDVQLANYLAGVDPGPVIAGKVGSELAKYLDIPRGSFVLLSDYNLTKNRFRHPEMDFQDFLRLPEIIDDGFVVPGNKRRSLEITHLVSENGRYHFWSLSLKATRTGELFATMFRKSKLKEARRVYRRALKQSKLIRDHKNELARRILRRASAA